VRRSDRPALASSSSLPLIEEINPREVGDEPSLAYTMMKEWMKCLI
jgi:hypothetical protein